MAYYVKVTPQVCKKLGHGEDRNNTADGNKLMWQADLNAVKGSTIYDRAEKVGGVCLSIWEAKDETDGVVEPREVYTPEEYKDAEPQEAPTDKGENSDVAPEPTPQPEGVVEDIVKPKEEEIVK